MTVLESPGTLQFNAAAYSVNDTAGVAALTVVRTVGSLGPVTVNYQTIAINAVPGVDFMPVAGVLTLASGQTSGTIMVPVLNDRWQNHDDFVVVALSSPGGGASLGAVSMAQLMIIDVDPDYTPPQATQLSWAGNAQAITSVTVTFNAPLDPTYATNPANYRLTVPTAGNSAVSWSSVVYNASTDAVTLVPQAPWHRGGFMSSRPWAPAPRQFATLPVICSTVIRTASPGRIT